MKVEVLNRKDTSEMLKSDWYGNPLINIFLNNR